MTAAEIRRLTETDWAVLRATRLAALAEAPYAFASTLERELAFTERAWRGRLADSATGTYVGADSPGDGLTGDGPAGPPGGGPPSDGAGPAPLIALAGLLRPGAGRAHWHLVSMWVSPSARGHGLAGRLVAAVCDLAGAEGAPDIELWVTLRNERARAFYRRAGFLGTGDQQLVRPDEPGHREERMLRPLR